MSNGAISLIVSAEAAASVRADKDSLPRQKRAVKGFAKCAGFEIVEEFYDAAVSGADLLDARPGFTEAPRHIAANGVTTTIVETASRFARDALVAEIGFLHLRDMGSAHRGGLRNRPIVLSHSYL